MPDWRYRTAWRGFDLFFRPWMRRRIHAVRMTGVGADLREERGPILICPNHSSWWDGFLVRELQRAVRPGASFHAVMLDEELGLRPFFRQMGAIGLRPNSVASVRRSLRELRALRAREPALMVAFFPQGRIWPSWRRPLGFQPGVRLFMDALAPVRILPLGIHLEAGGAISPVAYLSAGRLLEGGEVEEIGILERRVEEEVDAIHHFLAVHGEHEAEAWPARHGRLPRAHPASRGTSSRSRAGRASADGARDGGREPVERTPFRWSRR